MTKKQRFQQLRWANICGIIDNHGAVDSRLSPLGKGLLRHEDLWPMKLAGKWRWNFDKSVHCFCDTLTADEHDAIRTHLTKKYGIEWWDNGHHDLDHFLKPPGSTPCAFSPSNETTVDNRPVYLSLGAGVQSSALALMATAGGVGPMPKAAIFADTGDEPQSVYRYLDWLEKNLAFPVYRVGTGIKLSDSATMLRLSKKSGNTYIPTGLPVYTTEVTEVPHFGGGSVAETMRGMGRRQCTRTFKIEPINRKLRELSNGEDAICWIGISTDEAQRMKPSRQVGVESKWPLIELGLSRADCLKWMEDAGWPKPPRSACVYCPYHSDKEWLRLKTEEPTEFYAAVEFEKRLQTAYASATALRSTPYLHASRKPLSEVEFKPKDKEPNLFGNECEGICGV